MKKIMAIIIVTLFLVSITTIGVVAAYPTGYSLETAGTGFAELSSEQWYSFNRAVKMGTVIGSDRANILFNGGPQLNTIFALSYWGYTVQAGTFGQLAPWIAIYLHTESGKTLTDWFTDYDAGSPNVYFLQAEPYYTYYDHNGVNPPLNTWMKWDAFDSAIPLEWESLESTGSPHGAPTLAQYVTGAIQYYSSREYGSLYIVAIRIRMGYGGPWVNTLAYVDDVTINDYFENFGVDAIAGLEDLKTEITDLPDGDFKSPAADREAALIGKINDVITKIDAGDYKGAIMKLLSDIKPKLDYSAKQAWLVEPHQELLDKIDTIVEGLL